MLDDDQIEYFRATFGLAPQGPTAAPVTTHLPPPPAIAAKPAKPPRSGR